MITFELTFPHAASWNGKWSGADRKYIRAWREYDVPKELWDKDFFYRFDDGWEACISVRKCLANETRKLLKESAGFYGYDWMIKSLVNDGYIHILHDEE